MLSTECTTMITSFAIFRLPCETYLVKNNRLLMTITATIRFHRVDGFTGLTKKNGKAGDNRGFFPRVFTCDRNQKVTWYVHTDDDDSTMTNIRNGDDPDRKLNNLVLLPSCCPNFVSSSYFGAL